MGLFDIIEDIVTAPIKFASDFVEDPVDATVKAVTQPLRDGVDILQGLSEGEIRTKAVARFGADIVAGMAISEIIGLFDD